MVIRYIKPFVAMMIKLPAILLSVFLAYFGIAQEQQTISPEQKAEFLENLDKIMAAGDNQRMRLIRAGIEALSAATTDENEAMALFERCHKKVNFDDQGKKDKEWPNGKPPTRKTWPHPLLKE